MPTWMHIKPDSFREMQLQFFRKNGKSQKENRDDTLYHRGYANYCCGLFRFISFHFTVLEETPLLTEEP